ncbi:PAS-domain containing protein [Dongia soli]|uniref:histidine kinase n=1 Tax=Dongia soli TaxID=600628 RepID=A0ABU5EFB8_9PROT|nr:PAS-domain containing protein [Dongia soli]MDY0884301.1 PAS-domain containing protein [Dongia soli]
MKGPPNHSYDRLADFVGPAMMIAAAPGGGFIITAANDAFLTETGFDRRNLAGQRLPAPFGPGCNALLDLGEKVLISGYPADGVISLATPKGARRHHMVLMPQAGGASQPSQIIVVCTDTTATEAIRYLDDVLINVKDIIWSVMVETTIFDYVSPSVETLLGIDPQELLTVPWAWNRYIHPADLAAVEKAWDEAIEGALFDIEYRMIHPDGRVIWVRDHGELVRDAQGRALRIDGITQDINARRAAEAKAKTAEILYRTIVENQVELICRYRPNFVIVFCNAAYAGLYGLKPGDMVGHSLAEFLPTEELGEVQEVIERLARGNAISHSEVRKVQGDEKGSWYSWSDVAIFDAEGNIAEIQAIGRDVTGRYQMERDLQASEQRLRLAIDSIPDAFALYDNEDRLILCNKRYIELAISPTTIDPIGKTFEYLARNVALSSIAPMEAKDDPEGWFERRLQRHRNPPSEPVEVVLQDGRWLRVSERRTIDGGWVATWSEVTALKEAETRLRSAIAAFNEGFVFYDKNERLILCNDRFKALYPKSAAIMAPGVTLEEIYRYGMARGEFADDDNDSEAWLKREFRRIRQKIPHVVEQQLTDGRWTMVSRSPVADGGMVSIITDVTELKLRQDELQQTQQKLQQQTQHLTQFAEQLRAARMAAESANQAKSRFLAHMSHELRTPLNAILGFADVIRHGMFGEIAPVRYRDYVQYIHESGSHLLEMINDVLDLSKIEAGKFELKVEALDAALITQAGSKLVAGMAKENGVRLMIDIDPACPRIHGDARAIKQIIINLLSNGVKFTPAGGYVMLQIQTAGTRGFEIVVTDTGIGMSSDDIAKALDPFGQIDGTLARQHRGTGLGLPLVKNLAELQDGTLQIDSAPSRGTRVSVFLPWLSSLLAFETGHA